VAQTPTTPDLQPTLSELSKVPLSKTSALSRKKIFSDNPQYLADRTNGDAYATVLRLSLSVCRLYGMYCG